MNDEWLDDRVREAFSEVALPSDRLRRMATQRRARSSSRVIGVVVALAAAAVVAVIAWPLVAREPPAEPVERTTTAVTPPEPVAPPPVPVDARTQKRDQLIERLKNGTPEEQQAARRGLLDEFSLDSVALEALRPFEGRASALVSPRPRPTEAEPEDPVRTPVPLTTAPPLDVTGLWIGSTSAAMSAKIVVMDQTGSAVSGSVELQTPDGRFVNQAFTGTMKGKQLVLNAGPYTIRATVGGRRMTGRIEQAGHPAISVSLLH